MAISTEWMTGMSVHFVLPNKQSILIKCTNTKRNTLFPCFSLIYFIFFLLNFFGISYCYRISFLRISVVHGKRYGVMDKIKFYWFSFCLFLFLFWEVLSLKLQINVGFENATEFISMKWERILSISMVFK